MTKICINKCYGGFSISPDAALWLYERGWTELATPVEKYWDEAYGKDVRADRDEALIRWREYLKAPTPRPWVTVFSPDEKFVLEVRPEPRDHPLLVECVETLGDKANGSVAKLRIVEIPDGIDWEIDEYDGIEQIAERHRTWG